ncbi:MAG: hypothetical protein E8D46_17075 [Nitrospira sp.]|nr:hypothetical protein [Nitrospira sp.]TKB71833.1 MAG: hypothetical protein E8D46_17075 [Nitrospira sp.]
MTTRFVIPVTAALACTIFIAGCGQGSAPSKACVEAARLYAEALDVDRTVPEGEKAEKIAIKKESLEALEDRKNKACGE